MADRIIRDTSTLTTREIGQEVEAQKKMYETQRKGFERQWYDNNFFDDGKHFRFISRSTGKILDLSRRDGIDQSRRSIPKASRQIRAIANNLTTPDFFPIIYPEKISRRNYQDPQEYVRVVKEAKTIALRIGHWVEEEWKNQDLKNKLTYMIMLAQKNYISYMQIWPDAIQEIMKTQVYDAFEIYTLASITNLEDAPSIIKVIPKVVKEIRANEFFDEEKRIKVMPDNRFASSEVKQAYESSKFGKETVSDAASTALLHEAFIREYMNKENQAKLNKDLKDTNFLVGKKFGDPVIRQVFRSGGVTLSDKYVALPEYPFVDFRMEPGSLYGTALIERFMESNKSLDMIVSRLERLLQTMIVGSWSVRDGENVKITNKAGAQIFKYTGTPPTQNAMASVPSYVFNLIDLLNSFIEEQGTPTALGQFPTQKGVTKGVQLFESIKKSEFQNMRINVDQLKKTVKRITEKMLNIADQSFINPQTVERMERGEPDYFDIIGQIGLERRKKIQEADRLRGVVTIKKDHKVEIEMGTNAGFTVEGKRAAIFELAEYMRDLAREQLIPIDALKKIIERLLDTYSFGKTSEVMDALDAELPLMPQKQKEDIKIAVAEVFKDFMDRGVIAGSPEARVTESKVGTGQAISDIQKASRGGQR